MEAVITQNASDMTGAQTAAARRSLSIWISSRAAMGLGVSILLLVPCLWLPRISAGDLASHIYNTWLVQLIREGRVQGIWVANQWTNVLFDLALDTLSTKFGFAAAQKIAVSASVLIFFWSAFLLISEIAGRARWFIIPYLGILAYGSIFNMGLFNYYLGGSFSLLAMSLLWRPNTWRVGAAIFCLSLGWLAQPLPVLLALGLLAYRTIACRLSLQLQPLIWLISLGVLLLIRYWLLSHGQGMWNARQFLHSSGAEQSYMFDHLFRFTTILTLCGWAVALVSISYRQGWRRLMTSTPFQLYWLCVLAGSILPYAITFPWYRAWFGGVPERIGWVAAVLLSALFAQFGAGRSWGIAFTCLAVLYFGVLYSSASAQNRLEHKVETLVTQLPANSDIIADLRYPPGGGFDVSMILDRVCIQRCISFGNYEAATVQFRVRALPGNPIVAWSNSEPVPQQFFSFYPDRPLYQIYMCGDKATDVCMRTLRRNRTD